MNNNMNRLNEMHIGVQNLDLAWRALIATIQILSISMENLSIGHQSLQIQQEEVQLHRSDLTNDIQKNKQNEYQILLLEKILSTLERIEKKMV